MKHHEREFFVSMVRSGKVFINYKDIDLEVRPLTIDQSLPCESGFKPPELQTYLECLKSDPFFSTETYHIQKR